MTPLPLLLEPTFQYLKLALPLGGVLVAIGAWMLWAAWRRGAGRNDLRQWIATVFVTGLGAALLLQPLDWRLTVDDKGIDLRAPLDISATRGAIRWNDLQSLRFGVSAGRTLAPTVEFAGKDGTVLVLQSLDGVPDAYWPALLATVLAKAPQAQIESGKDRWLSEVRARARPTPGALGGWTYIAYAGGKPLP